MAIHLSAGCAFHRGFDWIRKRRNKMLQLRMNEGFNSGLSARDWMAASPGVITTLCPLWTSLQQIHQWSRCLPFCLSSLQLTHRLMFPGQPAVPKVRHSSHISLWADSNNIHTELRKKPEHAILDFQGDTSIHVWVLRECPGICEEVEGSVSPLREGTHFLPTL